MDNIKKKRKSNYLNPVTNVLIFCEGKKTEPNYFNGFKKDINKNAIYKDSILIKTFGLSKDTKRIVKHAKEYIEKNKITNAFVWCVYDKDDFKDDDFNNAEKMCNSYSSERVKFQSAWSNQCIEYWFILHFTYYDANNDRKQYIEYLNTKFKEIGFEGYKKNNEKIYEILKTCGKPKNAISYAKKRLKGNEATSPSKIAPATKVFALVEQLANYLAESDKNLFIKP